MTREKKIFLAYQSIARNKTHIEAAIDVSRAFNLSIFTALALIKEGKQGKYR